jgi:hypothetical protein
MRTETTIEAVRTHLARRDPSLGSIFLTDPEGPMRHLSDVPVARMVVVALRGEAICLSVEATIDQMPLRGILYLPFSGGDYVDLLNRMIEERELILRSLTTPHYEIRRVTITPLATVPHNELDELERQRAIEANRTRVMEENLHSYLESRGVEYVKQGVETLIKVSNGLSLAWNPKEGTLRPRTVETSG